MVRIVPTSVILSWPTPNYKDPVTRGNALLIVNTILISLTVCVVVTRLYTRLFINRWFGADDLFIVLALLCAGGMTACVILANVRYGWNRHAWDLEFSMIPPAFQVAYATKIVFSLSAMFTRCSLLLFYYRLVKDSGLLKFKLILHCFQGFQVSVGIGLVALTIWQCSPIHAFWAYPPIAGARCLDEGKLTLGCGIVNTFADLVTTILPIPMILQLKMPLRRRIGVIVLLGVGFIVTSAGAVRSYFVWKALIASYDQTWYTYGLWISAAVEIDLGVICACVPALRPFVAHVLGRRMTTVSTSLSSLGSKLAGMMSNTSSRNNTQNHDMYASATEMETQNKFVRVTNTVDIWSEPRSRLDNKVEHDDIGIAVPFPHNGNTGMHTRGESFDMISRAMPPVVKIERGDASTNHRPHTRNEGDYEISKDGHGSGHDDWDKSSNAALVRKSDERSEGANSNPSIRKQPQRTMSMNT